MKKIHKRSWFLIAVIAAEFVAIVYDAVFNESRIIKPIEAAIYRFRITDLPLLAATALLVISVMYWIICFILQTWKKMGEKDKRITRRVDCRFGWFGFLGFLGFMGIPVYIMQGQIWPFFFFTFFGFFGFFYEAKLNATLMDERFKEEQRRAQLTAYKIGFVLLWIVTWFTSLAGGRLSTDTVAIIFTVSSSLIIALVLFLCNYLLYRYDTEEEEYNGD